MPDVGGVEMSEAISVKVKMPDASIEETFLLYVQQRIWSASDERDARWISGYLQDNDDGTACWRFDDQDFNEPEYLVTHWMKLPPSPE